MSEMTRAEREAAARDWWAKKQAACDAKQAADAASSAEFVARKVVERAYIITDDRGILRPHECGTVDQIPPGQVIDLRTPPTPAPSDAEARLAALIAALRAWFDAGQPARPESLKLHEAWQACQRPGPVAHPAEARVKELEETAVEVRRTLAEMNDKLTRMRGIAEQHESRRNQIRAAVIEVINRWDDDDCETSRTLLRKAVGWPNVSTDSKFAPPPEPGPWIDGPPTHEGQWEWRASSTDQNPWTMLVKMDVDSNLVMGRLHDGTVGRLWPMSSYSRNAQSRFLAPLPEGGAQ